MILYIYIYLFILLCNYNRNHRRGSWIIEICIGNMVLVLKMEVIVTGILLSFGNDNSKRRMSYSCMGWD